MALMDFIKKQFIDVIQWTEETEGVLAYRYPMRDFEIQNGAKLTVRDSQMAAFVNEGLVADIFAPGMHTLNTQTLPVLTNLKNWDKLFDSPFKSDVYFFSTRLQLDRKWGTPNPITIRDKEFGIVRLRAFGIYSFRLSKPDLFYKEISGTRETYTVEELDGQLRNLVITSMTDMFGESGLAFIDMASNQEEFSARMKTVLLPVFDRYGLELDAFAIQNISLPEELQKMLDKRISVNIMGGIDAYTKLQVADAIPLAAQNEGGMAGIGAGLGAGMTVGQMMGQAMSQTMNPNAAQPAAPTPAPAPAPTPEAATSAVPSEQTQAEAKPSADDVVETLEKLHGLVRKGIITQEEFDTKKAELLGKLS